MSKEVELVFRNLTGRNWMGADCPQTLFEGERSSLPGQLATLVEGLAEAHFNGETLTMRVERDINQCPRVARRVATALSTVEQPVRANTDQLKQTSHSRPRSGGGSATSMTSSSRNC